MSQSPLTRRSDSVPGPVLYTCPQICHNFGEICLCLPLLVCAITVCNIIENDVWKRFGFNRSTSSFFIFFPLLFYPVLNNAATSVSSLVYRCLLNAIKIIFSRDSMCICKEKPVVDHILFNRQLMKSFLPPDWSSEGHLHLSVQNLLVDNNLSIISVAYHLVNSSPIGHILLIMCV